MSHDYCHRHDRMCNRRCQDCSQQYHERNEPHPDDLAVDRFSVAMKAKLAAKRAEGYGGWDDPEQCSVAWLSHLLVKHIDKGDPVDIGNFAMMIHQRGGLVAAAPTPPSTDRIAALEEENKALREALGWELNIIEIEMRAKQEEKKREWWKTRVAKLRAALSISDHVEG